MSRQGSIIDRIDCRARIEGLVKTSEVWQRAMLRSKAGACCVFCSYGTENVLRSKRNCTESVRTPEELSETSSVSGIFEA